MYHTTDKGTAYVPDVKPHKYCTVGIRTLGTLPDGRQLTLYRERGKFTLLFKVSDNVKVYELYRFYCEDVALAFASGYWNDEMKKLGLELPEYPKPLRQSTFKKR